MVKRVIGAAGAFRIGLNEVAIQLPLPVFAMELARARLTTRWFTQSVTQARIFDPAGAWEAGYLDEVVPAEALLHDALARAAQLATLPDPAFRLTKERERGATICRNVLCVLDQLVQTGGLGQGTEGSFQRPALH